MEKEWVFQRCREVQQSPNGFIDIWSREHWKSSIITFGKTIQDILASHGQDPLIDEELTFGIFSYNRPAAKKFLRQIKLEFESNKELKALFPDILYQEPKKESPKWSEDDGLVVIRKGNPRESTIEASGLIDSMPTGMHYSVRVYDDVVTLDNCRTKEMVDKTTQAWGLSLALGKEGGKSRYVGTFYADGDTYHSIIERNVAKPRFYPATDNGRRDGRPVVFSADYLKEKMDGLPLYDFACQYLCDPIPDDQAYFRESDFQFYKKRPKYLRYYGAGDYALTEGGGDFTEMGIAGMDPDEDLYLIDWYRGQERPDVWIETMLDLVKNFRPLVWAAESGQIRRAIEPFLNRRMRERKTWVNIEWFPAIADKPTMCRAFQSMAGNKRVYLPDNSWGKDLLAQLLRFPKGRMDDGVDVCGLFGRLLEDMVGGRAPSEKTLAKVNYDYPLEEEMNNWKTA